MMLWCVPCLSSLLITCLLMADCIPASQQHAGSTRAIRLDPPALHSAAITSTCADIRQHAAQQQPTSHDCDVQSGRPASAPTREALMTDTMSSDTVTDGQQSRQVMLA